jgi:hypothetical protein
MITVWLASHSVFADDMNFIITLDRADLQRRIDRMFPIVREDELVAVRMHHPQLILTGHSDRIGLRVRLDATAAERFSVSGRARVDGVLRFAADTGNFYLDNAGVEELQIDGVPDLYAGQIRQLADRLVRDLLQERPIYTLGQRGESKRIMGSKIKSIKVRDGKLVVELAMP